MTTREKIKKQLYKNFDISTQMQLDKIDLQYDEIPKIKEKPIKKGNNETTKYLYEAFKGTGLNQPQNQLEKQYTQFQNKMQKRQVKQRNVVVQQILQNYKQQLEDVEKQQIETYKAYKQFTLNQLSTEYQANKIQSIVDEYQRKTDEKQFKQRIVRQGTNFMTQNNKIRDQITLEKAEQFIKNEIQTQQKDDEQLIMQELKQMFDRI